MDVAEPIVKYETPPTLSVSYPSCASCGVEVENDGDGWYCARCGTIWDFRAGDGDNGELYEDWNGEPNPGEPRTHTDGYRLTKAEREAR